MLTNRTPNQLVIPDRSVVSPEGLAIINANQEIGSFAMRFCQDPGQAHTLITNENQIGSGQFGEICDIGNIAIKLSTPYTGFLSRESGKPTNTEDLIAQYELLTSMHNWLCDKPKTGICVPLQYFAMQKSQSYLLAMQLMRDMEPFHLWANNRSDHKCDIASFSNVIGNRILDAFADSGLWYGMTDVSGTGTIEDITVRLHSTNILVASEDSDPETALICIVDQNPLPSVFRDLLRLITPRSRRRNELADVLKSLQLQS